MFKEKEEIIVIAVLAIITSALLSGYGVYYFLNLRPVKKSPSESTIQPSKTSEENTTANELQSAQAVLENFFSHLNNKQYQEAASLYGWGYDDDPGNNLQTWPGTTNAETLENYCQSQNSCIRTKVLAGTKTAEDEYKFIVQFLTDEGKIYQYHSIIIGMEPDTDFNFRVKKIDGKFKVINPPLYHP